MLLGHANGMLLSIRNHCNQNAMATRANASTLLLISLENSEGNTVQHRDTEQTKRDETMVKTTHEPSSPAHYGPLTD